MPRYTDESRERVRDAVDFAEIVGARTELKRAGVRRLQGLCPFHDERTPSFGIDPVEKLYHCFGCGAGGDVFQFVMETEGLDFGAALESLAERYRVPLERETEDPRDAAKRERRERLLALLERTAAYYVRVLWEAEEAAPAREYLAGRGLGEDALRAYRVGWAPDVWDRVLTGSRRAGFTDEELHAAGLIQASRGGSGVIDRFRGRITFPLADERGRVLGFGARAMKDDQKPKYLNTSDGELFHKGRIVYGADLARAAAARAGRVVLVEGYTDVIALHQAGVPEVVAQMGTALTDAQVDAIARLAPKALFCQDPDRAGQESVARGIAALRTHNSARSTRAVEFKIVRLPAGADPADVVQRDGAEALRELLEAAVPIERFEVERALEQQDASTDELLAAAARVIAPMPSSVLRSELVKLVSDRLGLGEQLAAEMLRPGSPPQRPPVGRLARPQRRARPLPASGAAARAGRPAGRVHPPRAEREGVPVALHRAPGRGRAAARRDRRRRLLLVAHNPPGRALPARAPAPSRRAAAERRRAVRAPDRRAHRGREPPRRHPREARARSAAARPPPPRAAHLERPAHGRHHRRRRARDRAPARPGRDPPPADLSAGARAPFPSDTRTSVRINMDRDTLARQLAEGRSIESIARETGRSASTVAYWVNKHGLRSRHAPRHAARGGIEREQLLGLVEEGLSIRQIAARCGVSATTVRHWLQRYELKTQPARYARRDGPRPDEILRECPRHGWGPFVRVGGPGYYRCARCNTEAVSDRRRRVKEILVAEAGGRCVACGFDQYVGALQFHHRDPATKAFEVSRQGVTRSLDRLRLEAQKCVLLCANCHAMVEAGLLVLPEPAEDDAGSTTE